MRLAYLPFFRYRAIRPTGNCNSQKTVSEKLLAPCTRYNMQQVTSKLLLSEQVGVAVCKELTCRPALVDLLTDFLPELFPFPRPLMVA